MKTLKQDLLRLSKVSPYLKYSADLAKKLSASNEPTGKIIEAYFAAHPREYVKELEEFGKINDVKISKNCNTFIFVPAFNEEHNLAALVDQYTAQKGSYGVLNPDSYEICFVINYPESHDPEINSSYIKRFEHAIDLLIDKKKMHPNIHVLPKVFSSDEGSLGRARKYGMDYCLLRSMKQSAGWIDNSLIISNEGDTLKIPTHYITQFNRMFEDGKPRLVQGKIEYPQEITANCEPVRLFVGCREAVHFGQGLAVNYFPYFDGIMPVGRNFAVSPRVCAQVGGVDPIRRKDTDDDMNFGTGIHVLLGEKVKSACTIPLITNPRREVTIVRDIVTGKKGDSKKSYENFHENRAFYDLKYADTIAMVREEIPSKIPSRAIQCELVNQYFQWVLISRYKANLSHVVGFDEIITKHHEHKISYWEKEKQLCTVFERYLQRMTQEKRYSIEKTLISEALSWFNKFVQPLGVTYGCTYDGLSSVLQ